jgi:hypothetical protein
MVASPGAYVALVGAGDPGAAVTDHVPGPNVQPAGAAGNASSSLVWISTAFAPVLGFVTVTVYSTFHEASGFCDAVLPTLRTSGNAGCEQAFAVPSGTVAPGFQTLTVLRKPPAPGVLPGWQMALPPACAAGATAASTAITYTCVPTALVNAMFCARVVFGARPVHPATVVTPAGVTSTVAPDGVMPPPKFSTSMRSYVYVDATEVFVTVIS